MIRLFPISFLLACQLFFSILSIAQKPYGSFSGNGNKKTEKKLLKSARNESYNGNFQQAIEKYSELLKIDSANPMYNFEMAQTYYDNFLQPRSISYFEKAIKYSSDTLGEAYYFLASAYHLSGNYDKAKENYTKYLFLLEKYGTDLFEDEEKALFNDIKRRIEMCDNGNKLKFPPVDKILFNGQSKSFEINSIGKDANSDFDDYGAVLSANDSVMYFTTRREGATGGKYDYDDKLFEDIYMTSLSKKGWGPAFSLGAPVNTSKHEGIIHIAPDGKTIYFYKGVKQGTFYETHLNGNTWTKPSELYKESSVNTKAWETSFYSFTINSNELYLVSDREGSLGGRDIFVAKKQPDGSWGALENMGSDINSKFDEDAPHLTPDGNTMYFSSNGHNSMGGFDIFRSERVNGKWSAPVNMGVPINSPGDDIYFIIANKNDRAYFSSSAQATDGTRDLDIYEVDICDDVPESTINGLAMGIAGGTVTVMEKESGKEVTKFDVKDGKYSVKLPRGKNYAFVLNTMGIEPVSADIYVPRQCKAYDLYQEINFTQAGQPLVFRNAFFDVKKEAGSQNFSEFLSKADKTTLPLYNEVSVNTFPAAVVAVKDTIKTIGKDTVQVTTISFNSILFAYDKSSINKEFKADLDKVVKYLKDVNTKEKIEVAGYTDSRGSDSYNLALSKRRASAIVSYLASKGIKKNRMKAVGYGEANPIAPNETPDGSDNPDGRAKNRRTEIVIVH